MRHLPLFILLLACTASADEYPLDGLVREVPATGRMACPDVQLSTYKGQVIRYHKPVQIYVAFREKLVRFEEVARDAAIEVYGRAPRRVVHAGAYNCRRIRGYPTLLSEHGLGNALDVVGFDFGPSPRKTASVRRGSFEVRVGKHWKDGSDRARFLGLVAERLIADGDFRVILGPSYPGHQDHFHLDMAPYRVIDVFGDGT